jgi:hypothetical protein
MKFRPLRLIMSSSRLLFLNSDSLLYRYSLLRAAPAPTPMSDRALVSTRPPDFVRFFLLALFCWVRWDLCLWSII